MLTLVIHLALAFASLDERELRKQKLAESVYDPGVIPGKWRQEYMNDFENLGAFVEKKCAIYPNETYSMPLGRIRDIYHFDRDWVAFISHLSFFKK